MVARIRGRTTYHSIKISPMDLSWVINDGVYEVEPRGEGAMVRSKSLDDHDLRLAHYLDATLEKPVHEEQAG